jgi:hypothetical protein
VALSGRGWSLAAWNEDIRSMKSIKLARILSIMVLMLVPVTALASEYESQSRVVTGWNDLGDAFYSCEMTSGKTGEVTGATGYIAHPQAVIYFPRIPAGSTVHSATVTLWMIADAGGSGAWWQYAPIQSTAVEPFFYFRSLGSQLINSPQTSQNTYWYLVSPHACNAVTSQPFTFEFPPEALPGFVNLQYPSMSFKTNFPDDHVRGGLNSPDFWIDGYEYTIEYTPPPPLELFPSASLPEEQRRLLLSIDSSDPARYSSALQSGPATMLVGGKTRDGDSVGRSRTIHIRVIDPPDPSPYRADAKPRDNDGRLVLTPAFGTTIAPWGKDSDGNDVYTVTSDAAGDFRIYARAASDPSKPPPGLSAGDNYIIEAAWPDENGYPGFAGCGQAACPQTGEIQVWKRTYVEADRMFKSGSFLKESVGASPNAPVKVKLESIPKGVGKGKYLMFIHAPSVMGTGPFWSEVVKVTEAPNNKTNEVTVERLNNDYEGPESLGTDSFRYLADAVGLVSTATEPTDGDLYPNDIGLLQSLYEMAFVEYVLLSNDPLPYVPYESDLKETTTRLDSMNLIPAKWFLNVGRHNTQHLLAGSNQNPDGALGLGSWWPGEPWAWVFNKAIDKYGPTFASPKARLRREVTVHELTHNWGVRHDNTTTGSNDRTQWNSTTLLCTMHAGNSCPGTSVCPEFYDDIVAFHYIHLVDTPHSEYLMIRRKQDPLPY